MLYTGLLTKDIRLRVSEVQMQKLVDISKASGLSVSQVLRQLIDKL